MTNEASKASHFARLSILAMLANCGVAFATSEIDALMSSVKTEVPAEAELSVVREAILREAATALGARAGMMAKGCDIKTEIEKRSVGLDRRFRFSDLIMGKGLLPPVISEAKDSVSLTEKALRWSSRVYTLDEPARLIVNAPTWRDWLYVGMPMDGCGKNSNVVNSTLSSVHRPSNPSEEKFFRSVLAKSYEQGKEAAQAVFDTNLARLNRSYAGMRNYFDLYQRGIVSAPVIVSNTDVVNNDDPNVLLIGDTLIRITMQPKFVSDPESWVPLNHNEKGVSRLKKPTEAFARQENAGAPSPVRPSQGVNRDGSSMASLSTRDWDIRKDDVHISAMLRRWAQREGWTIFWNGAPDIKITGNDVISNKTLPQAVVFLVDQLEKGGMGLKAVVRSDKVIEVRASELK